MSHFLTCERPDVCVTRGVTKSLHHCRSCHAETWVPR